jgi:hypothetical protein
MFLLASFAFLTFDAFACALASSKIVDCSSASPEKFVINSLTLSADTVSPGDNVSLGLLYTNPSLVTDGTVTTTVTYNFIPLSPTVEPLCNSVPCPLEPGQHDGSSSIEVPTGISGSVVTKIIWTVANIQVLCIQITIKVMRMGII